MTKAVNKESTDQDLQRAIDFHGHVCPGLVYGFRAAKAAMRELGNRAVDEEIVAIVENDSCAVDAVQVITGCTFGKGNLLFEDRGKQVYTFLSRRTGDGVRISVEFSSGESPEESSLWKKFRDGDRSAEVVKAVSILKEKKIRAILDAPEEDVLRITPARTALPSKARIYPSVRCSMCGEKVMEPRARVRDGRIVCIPCHENT